MTKLLGPTTRFFSELADLSRSRKSKTVAMSGPDSFSESARRKKPQDWMMISVT